jgi:hypothetical protein
MTEPDNDWDAIARQPALCPAYDWAKLCSTVRREAVALARHYEHSGWTIGALIRYHAADPRRAEWVVHACREYQP